MQVGVPTTLGRGQGSANVTPQENNENQNTVINTGSNIANRKSVSAGEARSPNATRSAKIITNISKNPGVITGAQYYELKEMLLSSEQDLKRQRIRVINPSARVGEKREFGSERPIVICYDLGNRYRCQKSSTR